MGAARQVRKVRTALRLEGVKELVEKLVEEEALSSRETSDAGKSGSDDGDTTDDDDDVDHEEEEEEEEEEDAEGTKVGRGVSEGSEDESDEERRHGASSKLGNSRRAPPPRVTAILEGFRGAQRSNGFSIKRRAKVMRPVLQGRRGGAQRAPRYAEEEEDEDEDEDEDVDEDEDEDEDEEELFDFEEDMGDEEDEDHEDVDEDGDDEDHEDEDEDKDDEDEIDSSDVLGVPSPPSSAKRGPKEDLRVSSNQQDKKANEMLISRAERLLLRWVHTVCEHFERRKQLEPQEQKVILLERRLAQKTRDLEKQLLEERLVISERAAKLNVPMDLFPAEQVRWPLNAT